MASVPNVAQVVEALNTITGGRCVTSPADLFSGRNRFVVTKSSNIPGKAVTETPGLVFGDPLQPVHRLAVTMTLTESQLELAGATRVDAIVAHHPIADAANSGGVPLRSYLSLYGIAVFELHEAFHGLHPGLAYIHGHRAFRIDIAYGGVPGNVMNVGTALEGIETAGDILARLGSFGGFEIEEALLRWERELRGSAAIEETNVATGARILHGTPASPVRTILHIFPHTGFTVGHLEQALREHPEVDTVIASISRVRPEHPLVEKAREHDLVFIVGNTHAMEILENGMPLAVALQSLLPTVEVALLRERATLVPLAVAGTPAIREYALEMANRFLLPKPKQEVD
jgi:hypothetical protein